MKYLVFVFSLLLTAFLSESCNNATKKVVSNVDSTAKMSVGDSTVYGVCGDGTAMHTLELISDAGDTIVYSLNNEEETDVEGGLLVGDRLAILGSKMGDENVATKVINLTTLLGKWTSLDKNFEIKEGGVIQSNVKAETNHYTSWKIYNGKLLLNKDTFQIDNLGADSLYLENNKGIFVYKRLK
jgi:hypothetical protein